MFESLSSKIDFQSNIVSFEFDVTITVKLCCNGHILQTKTNQRRHQSQIADTVLARASQTTSIVRYCLTRKR